MMDSSSASKMLCVVSCCRRQGPERAMMRASLRSTRKRCSQAAVWSSFLGITRKIVNRGLSRIARISLEINLENRRYPRNPRSMVFFFRLLCLSRFALQRRQRFRVYVPFLQDAKDDESSEAGAHQHAKDARRLLLANRL